MNPTQQQLDARLNPTAATLNLPANGELFRLSADMDPTGSSGIFYRDASGALQNLNFADLTRSVYGANADSLGGPANFKNGLTILGQQILKNQYGIDFNTIQEKRYNDLATLQQNGVSRLDPTQLKTLINSPQPPAGSGNITVNNTPNTLGTPLTGGAPQNATSLSAPTVNLQPGDTGDQVKKLQDYLVSKGLMTQAQVNTGYGTYGPQTTAAVAALQKSLGVDNSTGVGYFGPRTMAALRQTTGATNTQAPSHGTVDPSLLGILNNPSLSGDQRAAIQSIYNAVSTNDTDTASRIQAAMKAATEYSSPYFKAQTQLALDALQRGISAKDGDLAFSENQLKSSLEALRANTAASSEQLSFEHQQELKQLEQKYETDLGTTRDNLAASGFTSSSKRARSEQILSDNNQGLVESSNKTYGYQTGNLNRSLSTQDASTQAQLANLQRLSAEGKLDLTRSTEEKVGTSALSNLGYSGLLGQQSGNVPIGGSIPRQQATDALSFANSFVF